MSGAKPIARWICWKRLGQATGTDGSSPATCLLSPVTRCATGYTLIELIMVIVVIGVLAGVSSFFLARAIDIWQIEKSWEENVTEGRMAMDWMVREVREIKSTADIYIADDDNLQFLNANDVTLQFQRSGNNILRNSDVLTDAPTALLFEYFNQAGAELTGVPLSAADRAAIWSIRLTLTIPTKTPKGTENVDLVSVIFPRNIHLQE